MRTNNKRILTLALAIVMVAAMTACGSKPSSSSSSAPSTSSETTSSQPSSASPSESAPAETAYDATAQRYVKAITGARDADMNSAYDIFTHDSTLDMTSFSKNYADMKKENGSAYTDAEMLEGRNNQNEMAFGLLGFTPADVESYAISISGMMTSAYGVAVVKPIAGKEAVVEAGLNNFVETQRKNFEQYLPDQYEIAKAGYVKKLADGTMIMVVSEKQDAVYDAISKGLEAK